MRLGLRRFGTLGGTVVPTFASGLITSKIYPSANSTNAIGIYRADGTTQDVYYDSTNGRIGINTGGAPSGTLHVYRNDTSSVNTFRAEQAGAGAANSAMFHLSADGTSTSQYAMFIRCKGTGLIFKAVNASNDVFSVFTSGRVGLYNITAPTAWLHAPAGTTSEASLCLPHGVAPTAPVNGDMWTTTAGLYVRINGATVGPLS